MKGDIIMKYCSNCGSQLTENSSFCQNCGNKITAENNTVAQAPPLDKSIVNILSGKVRTEATIWLIIGIIQICYGGIAFYYSYNYPELYENFYIDWSFVLIVGILNIISSRKDFKFSSKITINPVGITERYSSIVAPIIVLIYNILFGGLIGVIGSIYYMIAVRGYVKTNEQAFYSIEQEYLSKD